MATTKSALSTPDMADLGYFIRKARHLARQAEVQCHAQCPDDHEQKVTIGKLINNLSIADVRYRELEDHVR